MPGGRAPCRIAYPEDGSMDDRQIRALSSYTSALHNLGTSAMRDDPELPGLRDDLQAIVEQIGLEGGKQHVAVNGRFATTARAQVLVFRENYMLPLAKLVRPLFKGEPRMQSALKVPHKRANPEVILAAAERMLKALQPHAKLLAAARINRQRIVGLRAGVRQLKKVVAAAAAGGADRGAPTQRLKPLFARARELVIAIDGIQSSFRSPADYEATWKLEEWKKMSRVGKKMGRPRKRRGGGGAARGTPGAP
jgi:hypothetical protein